MITWETPDGTMCTADGDEDYLRVLIGPSAQDQESSFTNATLDAGRPDGRAISIATYIQASDNFETDEAFAEYAIEIMARARRAAPELIFDVQIGPRDEPEAEATDN